EPVEEGWTRCPQPERTARLPQPVNFGSAIMARQRAFRPSKGAATPCPGAWHMTPPPEPWPTDPTELACLAASAETTPEVRERATADLISHVQRVARLVAASIRGQARRDLVDDSVSHVLGPERIGKYQRSLGPFLAWCRSVLKNHLVDQLPRRDAHRRREGHAAAGRARDASEAEAFWRRLEDALDLASPFSPEDLATLERWKVADRIVLLCLGGLWHKVPSPRWCAWLEEYGLESPFPPADFE